MNTNSTNDKLIHGDESSLNQSQAFPPLDEATCSESGFCAWCGELAENTKRGYMACVIRDADGEKRDYFCNDACAKPWAKERGVNFW